jgi:hypothetical protein
VYYSVVTRKWEGSWLDSVEEEIHHFFDVQNSHTRGTENLTMVLLRLRKSGAVTPNPHTSSCCGQEQLYL